MCLSAMMMGGGGGGQFFSELPNQPAAKMYRNLLWVVLLAHLGLAIAFIVVAGTRGIFELIAVMVLFCANSQANFCCMVMYILRLLLGLLQMFSFAGLILQNSDIDAKKGEFIIACLFVAFYIIALVISFYAYREYKAITMGEAGVMGAMGGGGFGSVNPNQSDARENPGNEGDYQRIPQNQANQAQPAPQPNNVRDVSGNNNNNYNAFQGRGVRLGGD
ncbi:unnamed protein product [Moneuplotes crassus]|uniref:Uncharacterized protein n=1 Tax=Euplotes crassus TaxID=5936 RepID=A0AAD1XR59_EUPCR|nr:unnamed protein product [Moneuplotes crassus]